MFLCGWVNREIFMGLGNLEDIGDIDKRSLVGCGGMS